MLITLLSCLVRNEQLRTFQYSPEGSMIAYLLPTCIRIQSVSTLQVIVELPINNALEIEFSPKGTYISTWERMVRTEDGETQHKNLIIWESATGKQIASFPQKAQTGWNIQWTETESFFVRLVSNEVHVYSPTNAMTLAEKIRLENLSAFSISPGKRAILATFVPEKKGAPATVQLWEVGLGLGSNQKPLSTKSFFRADTCTFYWNRLGTNVIVFTHTDVDATGQSYYGETQLYYLSVAGTYEARVDLGKPGPIHDVAWSPNSKEFVVVYGTMPARATLFDHKATPVYQFGSGPRNFVKYSPGGRIICIAGFGNLSGEMEFWDRKTCMKVSTVQASNSSACEWAPDGRHVMTSTLYKRLKVDNGVKIWHYTGVLVHKHEVKELHHSAWRPLPMGIWDEGGALDAAPVGIPVEASTPVKKVGAYRPPGARAAGETTSTFNALLNHERESPSSSVDSNLHRNPITAVGAPPPPIDDKLLSKAALKNKKKRENKKAHSSEDPTSPASPNLTNGNAASSTLSPSAPPFTPASDKDPELEKKIKNVNKKLAGIAEIRDKIKYGEKVEKNQMSKLEDEDALRAQLQTLISQRQQ
ncbi:hypothetical protein SmJEL517_g05533 [Synchytrium microbalum]|uniref:Eukaryotic translation initiation factor 2A n=1 Tax=Synchytrium microbalum TaxID=1806994 RepID=A0A507BUZ7_9FUNG|nr:uncharacterized protein SmJEL517_g05533 [Synchytrium microbalum]TPX31011.1 hypothetical protein SmJEL517_g05533 [Synchytrium microbalum]